MFSETPIASDLPVLVIGAAGMDMVGRVRSDLKPGTSNPAQIRLSYGGTGRNVAENLLRLGMPVRFISVVGNDPSGKRLVEALKETGANTEAVLHSNQYPTGTYLAVLTREGKLSLLLVN